MTIEINAKNATITPSTTRQVTVTLEDVNLWEVLSQFNVKDILDEIGQDACEDHFDLEPRE